MKPLRDQLLGAIASREACHRGQRGRADWHQTRIAIDRLRSFLRCYPAASDDRCRQWARDNWSDADRIITKTNQQLRNQLWQKND